MSPNIPELIKNRDDAALRAALQQNPALADGKNEQGIPYLLFAAYYRNQPAIDLLKKHKSSLNIFEAAAIGDTEKLQELAGQDASLVNGFAPDGFTPLGLACYFGQAEAARLLISLGAGVNIASSNSFRVAPLHSACAISHFELVKLLVEHGADVNARQSSGVTPLHSAAHNGQLQIAELLVEHGAEVNAQMDSGQTPLSMAEEKGFSEVAGFLRAKGGK